MIITQKNTIICGDFNIRNLEWPQFKLTKKDCPYANEFIEFMHKTQLKQFVNEPTREKSFLDLVLSANPDFIRDVTIRESFSSSDHKMVEFKIQETFSQSKRIKFYRRNLNKSYFSILNQAIFQNKIDITITYSTEEKYNLFRNELLKLFDIYFPLKRLNKIVRQKYPKIIKRLYNEKIKLYKLSKRFPDNGPIKLNLKIISNQLKKQLKLFYDEKEKKPNF